MEIIRRALFVFFALALSACVTVPDIPKSERLTEVKTRVTEPLKTELAKDNLRLGAPVFIRIFKETSELELWVKLGETYKLFKTYPICKYSGRLGPKLKEGDRQAPEGIYWVSASQLNPLSDSHLSFNLGFPNAYDVSLGRTGSYLMVHGGCGSIGCYAMTDPAIEEIYLLVEAALKGGQAQVQVHALPFRISSEKLTSNSESEWIDFWRDLARFDQSFEETKKVPNISVIGTKYVQNGFVQ